MKKAVNYACVFFILIFCIMFFMSCDDDIGLGDTPQNTPENVFAGGEWEVTYANDGGAEYTDYRKISFTNNTFSFYHKKDRIDLEETYTGTYSLFYGEFKAEYIKFVSDTPEFNRTARYDFDEIKPNGEKYPDDTVRLIVQNDIDSVISGLYTKIN